MRPGYDKAPRYDSREKGQKKKPNMFTVGSSTSATFILPVETCWMGQLDLLQIIFDDEKGQKQTTLLFTSK